MALSEAGAAIIGAALGAGGAVTAQVIGSFFTLRKDRERFEWEREQADAAREAARKSRFADEKRSLYDDVVTDIDLTFEALVDAAEQRDPGREVVKAWAEGSKSRQHPRLQLVAPVVADKQIGVGLALFNVVDALDHQFQKGESPPSCKGAMPGFEDFSAALEELREAMRDDLGIEVRWGAKSD
ncbi:hypothetical protein [Nocardioides soli]|uniref:Uncharacterized protein n=1 Tax=Nocardioides soli TaxID=1036020 RepID=A0A7W4VZC4_9ACTN|nr:hypothetical protein [Nocardioides soli]MBB3044514.1 hypothetical protein [Nocardioides soli]